MSFSDSEATRLRKAFASLSRGSAATPGCPEPERFWQAARGELPAAEIRDLIDHTSECSSCSEDWRLAFEMAPEVVPPAASFPSHRSHSRPNWWLAVAAAGLLVLVSVPLWRAFAPSESQDVLRAPGQSAAIESLLPESAVQPRSNCVLRWSPGPSSVTAYNLLISTESFDILIRQEGLLEPIYRVPPGALDQVPAGGKILWQVEAIGPADRGTVSDTFVQRLE